MFVKTRVNEIFVEEITSSKGKLVVLRFKDVFVYGIRFYNENGNTINTSFSMVKVVATYKF